MLATITHVKPQPQTILLVEDEVLIRFDIADYLRECGFHVIEAANADEALSILKSELPVDLVFSDVQMPGSMDGFGLARWLRKERPRIGVILTSGVAKTSELSGELGDIAPLERKPYDARALINRIRVTLAKLGGGE